LKPLSFLALFSPSSCWIFFDVEIRDLKDGISFCSVVKDGVVIDMGATFLKHQFIVNTCDKPGQPAFLPFRESREFVIRAIWGRETKPRDSIDVAMSVIGQAYATYASNRDAYERLRYIYEELMYGIEDIETLAMRMKNRLGHDDIKKLRQVGISPEELLHGFPHWDTLESKNTLDKSYQEISVLPLDIDGPLDVDWEADYF